MEGQRGPAASPCPCPCSSLEEILLQDAARLQPTGVQGGRWERAGVEDGLPWVRGGEGEQLHVEAGQEGPAAGGKSHQGDVEGRGGTAGAVPSRCRGTSAPPGAACPRLMTPGCCPCWPASGWPARRWPRAAPWHSSDEVGLRVLGSPQLLLGVPGMPASPFLQQQRIQAVGKRVWLRACNLGTKQDLGTQSWAERPQAPAASPSTAESLALTSLCSAGLEGPLHASSSFRGISSSSLSLEDVVATSSARCGTVLLSVALLGRAALRGERVAEPCWAERRGPARGRRALLGPWRVLRSCMGHWEAVGRAPGSVWGSVGHQIQCRSRCRAARTTERSVGGTGDDAASS